MKCKEGTFNSTSSQPSLVIRLPTQNIGRASASQAWKTRELAEHLYQIGSFLFTMKSYVNYLISMLSALYAHLRLTCVQESKILFLWICTHIVEFCALFKYHPYLEKWRRLPDNCEHRKEEPRDPLSFYSDALLCSLLERVLCFAVNCFCRSLLEPLCRTTLLENCWAEGTQGKKSQCSQCLACVLPAETCPSPLLPGCKALAFVC